MANPLQQTFADGFVTLFGDPSFMGMAVIAFFTGAVLLYPTHPALKVLAFFGGVLLAVPFFGWATLILGFGLGIIIWFAARRIWG